ncbi:enoyl-CoA hydratase/isomerase family protein [Trypanosoma conorhini]|uniref:3-hydroxyisobutyryl-CoA hydrolase n=1 Tax=Trypanosoma conorhini TaxID=83891 RepID=A0A422QC78_9TRYP|nr:enoyl-CoA hydratase/isomerase family protein [Trypanosoma conorhini]RNF27545.1 enoyl-CoA hydratase/isomerase family protein [Trypanosoma conorhini]
MPRGCDGDPHAGNGENTDTLRVVDFPCARLLTLCRPSALNALSLEMAQHMLWLHLKKPHPRLPCRAIYVLKGAGTKSFCAGGDIRDIVTHGTLSSFLSMTYRLNYHILTMPNPQVSLWNGYVMGGGVGVSVHGRYRVASEHALFAMPETAIGMFPDNGMTYRFQQLPFKGLGLYLGLTGARLKGADLAHAGLATHYVPSASFAQLEERLCSIDDPARTEACLEEFAVKDLPPFTLEPHRETLARIFALEDTTTVEGIVEALSADGGEFALQALKLLRKASPTCLKVTLELFRRVSRLSSMREAMSLEYNVIQRIAATNEFAIGVRALLIDKTGDSQWERRTLEEVTPSAVEHFFDGAGLAPWEPEAPWEAMAEAAGEAKWRPPHAYHIYF